MSETANVLAELLTQMDKKLDALAEQQKALDAKLERYAAFTVKKLDDRFQAVENMESAQMTLLNDKLTEAGKRVDAMEEKLKNALHPEEREAAFLKRMTEMTETVENGYDRFAEHLTEQCGRIERSMMDGFRTLTELTEADLKLAQDHSEALSRKLSSAFEYLYDRALTNQELIEKPDAVIHKPDAEIFTSEAKIEKPDAPIETVDAPIENPEASIETVDAPIENPEAPIETIDAPIENPEAEYDEVPDVPIENPEAVIDTGKEEDFP